MGSCGSARVARVFRSSTARLAQAVSPLGRPPHNGSFSPRARHLARSAEKDSQRYRHLYRGFRGRQMIATWRNKSYLNALNSPALCFDQYSFNAPRTLPLNKKSPRTFGNAMERIIRSLNSRMLVAVTTDPKNTNTRNIILYAIDDRWPNKFVKQRAP